MGGFCYSIVLSVSAPLDSGLDVEDELYFAYIYATSDFGSSPPSFLFKPNHLKLKENLSITNARRSFP